jgi:hypothetical protein
MATLLKLKKFTGVWFRNIDFGGRRHGLDKERNLFLDRQPKNYPLPSIAGRQTIAESPDVFCHFSIALLFKRIICP